MVRLPVVKGRSIAWLAGIVVACLLALLCPLLYSVWRQGAIIQRINAADGLVNSDDARIEPLPIIGESNLFNHYRIRSRYTVIFGSGVDTHFTGCRGYFISYPLLRSRVIIMRSQRPIYDRSRG